jgi:hypothetical protein
LRSGFNVCVLVSSVELSDGSPHPTCTLNRRTLPKDYYE